MQKRYLLHVAGFNLGLLMRTLLGHGTPKGWAEGGGCIVFALGYGDFALIAVAFFSEHRLEAVMPLAVLGRIE